MVEGSEFSGQLELIVQGEEVYIVSDRVIFRNDYAFWS
jgi:hypothetical protein